MVRCSTSSGNYPETNYLLSWQVWYQGCKILNYLFVFHFSAKAMTSLEWWSRNWCIIQTMNLESPSNLTLSWQTVKVQSQDDIRSMQIFTANLTWIHFMLFYVFSSPFQSATSLLAIQSLNPQLQVAYALLWCFLICAQGERCTPK